MTLVLLLPPGCPDCGTPTATTWWEQPALFYDCGYGATIRTTREWCPGCGWYPPDRIESVNPRPPRVRSYT